MFASDLPSITDTLPQLQEYHDSTERTQKNRENRVHTQLSQVYLENGYLFPTTTDHQQERHSFQYLKKEDIQKVGMTEKKIYSDAVANLPIACVDVFLYHPSTKQYLLVLRKDPPAKNFWWPPGGRVFKGELLTDCARRKCREEIGATDVHSVRILGVAETFFPDSAWNNQTHTINTLVLVTINSRDSLQIDDTCLNFKWLPIDVFPENEDPYVQNIYTLAQRILFPSLSI